MDVVIEYPDVVRNLRLQEDERLERKKDARRKVLMYSLYCLREALYYEGEESIYEELPDGEMMNDIDIAISDILHEYLNRVKINRTVNIHLNLARFYKLLFPSNYDIQPQYYIPFHVLSAFKTLLEECECPRECDHQHYIDRYIEYCEKHKNDNIDDQRIISYKRLFGKIIEPVNEGLGIKSCKLTIIRDKKKGSRIKPCKKTIMRSA